MKHKPTTTGGSIVETLVIVAVAIGLALGIQAFLVKPYRIPSESMVPTLEVGQRVLVNRLGNNFGDPSVGDVVVFHPPRGADENLCGKADLPEGQVCDKPTADRSDQNFVKRVVAVGGDRISVRDGKVILNGKRQDADYVRDCEGSESCDLPKTITVPPDHFFMMGDNRGASADSREWGPVPKKWIIGGAFATYWPPKRIGPL